MRRKLIAANWKMHKSIAEATAFASALRERAVGIESADLLVFPPFLSVGAVARVLEGSNVGVGAQDLHWETHGAWTGEVSAAMISDAGARWVLVGHSERRHQLGESDEIVAQKLHAALAAGLRPILCVGELLAQRDAGRAEDVVRSQLVAALGSGPGQIKDVVLAYEPVWAIGTGRTATAEDAEAMHRTIRGWARDTAGDSVAKSLRIQYGGSVKPENARGLLSRSEIDGALVGGASLEVDGFLGVAAGSA